ncbi:hypothetical protein HD601_000723 [Jiangella mangrovi]|uniref:Uncharacterized protein n=1 Tax=Jiangella mangrovi TaxID=1524084 RepID=A0A7W9LJK7_9ACTN|nr:hypothetical protein [Jiangella mangrovi]MBB5786148.1 hypothetical protein [Jiangella mangrovi]
MDDAAESFENGERGPGGDSSLLQQRGQVVQGVFEGDFRREERGRASVLGDDLPHPAAKDGADEDVRVEHQPAFDLH